MAHPDTCLLCGTQSTDIRVSLVEVEKPERMVEVQVPANHREGSVTVKLSVPERYYAVPRCRDEAACEERRLLADAEDDQVQPVTVPMDGPIPDPEDPTSWL